MANIDDSNWTVVFAIEDGHGDQFEDHARDEASNACRTRHRRAAGLGGCAADDLPSLQSINRMSARPFLARPPLLRKAVAPGAAALLA